MRVLGFRSLGFRVVYRAYKAKLRGLRFSVLRPRVGAGSISSTRDLDLRDLGALRV